MKRNRRFLLTLLAVLFLASGEELRAAPRTLDIYFIDVEGGAATLIVTPLGESLLIDSGNPGTFHRIKGPASSRCGNGVRKSARTGCGHKGWVQLASCKTGRT